MLFMTRNSAGQHTPPASSGRTTMQLTIFSDYGLRVLMFLAARTDKFSTAREMAEFYGISHNHLVKVVHRLAQLGYVRTTKGKGGGVELAIDPQTMKLGDIVRALEPNMNIVECFDRETNTCRITRSCKVRHYLREANEAFIASLNGHSLADATNNKTFL
jgi:Rrf2 family nitric oxide-sensitive transcriptional repressor